MGRKVVWSKRAKLEFREIAAYWAKRNKSTAYSRSLRNLIREKMKNMAAQPDAGSLTDEHGIRRKLIREYFVFYEASDTTLQILAIWDTRRNPGEAPYPY